MSAAPTVVPDSWETFSVSGLRAAGAAPAAPTETPTAPEPLVTPPERRQDDEPMPDFAPPTTEPHRCPNIDPDTDLPTCKAGA